MVSGQDGLPVGAVTLPIPSGEHYTAVVTDVVDFSARERSDEDRRIIRAGHMDILRKVLGDLWGQCPWNDRGDGLLMVVPPVIPIEEVMRRMCLQLPQELDQYNRGSRDSAKFRLRWSGDVGPVKRDAVGISGEVLIRATRLVDAMPIRKRMEASPGAGVGVIASDFVYENVITNVGDWVERDSWDGAEVDVQGYRGRAWIRLIGKSPQA